MYFLKHKLYFPSARLLYFGNSTFFIPLSKQLMFSENYISSSFESQHNEKKFEFYWWYKNHILVDSISGLPICDAGLAMHRDGKNA